MIGALPTSPLRRREERTGTVAEKRLVISIFDAEADADEAGGRAARHAARSSTTRSASSSSTSAASSRPTRSARRAAARARRPGPSSGSWGPSGLGVGVVGGALVGKLHHKDLGLDDADRERLGAALRGGKAAVGVLADPDELVAVESILVGHGGQTEAHELDEAALREAAESAGRLTASGSVPGRGRAPRASAPRSTGQGPFVPDDTSRQ